MSEDFNTFLLLLAKPGFDPGVGTYTESGDPNFKCSIPNRIVHGSYTTN
jgi:hypothetical protein